MQGETGTTGARDRGALAGRRAAAAMFAANGFLMGAWAPQIPLLLPRHQITESTLGLLILVLGLGAVSAMLFSGRLIAAYGHRAVLTTFAFAAVPVLPLVVLAPSLWTLALAMALMGAVIGCMDVAMNASAVAVERRLGRAIMSSSHGFWSLGGFVGASAGGLALARAGAEAQALLAAALVLAIVFLARPFLAAPDPRPTPAQGAANTARPSLIPRDAAIWILGAMTLFAMIPEGAVLDWAALYMAGDHATPAERAGLAFALFSGTMALMRFAGDGVRNRFGAVATLRVSALVAATGLLGAALAPSEALALAAFAFAGLGVANMVPVMFSAAGNHGGLHAAAALSTVTMCGYSGILVAPSAIGFAAEHAGFRPTFAALALLLLVVAAMARRAEAADGVRHLSRRESVAA